MKTARTCRHRTSQLAGIVAFVALLCVASPTLAVPFLGAAGSFTVLNPSVVVNTGPGTIMDDRSDFVGLGFIEGSMVASEPEFASMLLFVGGLISMAGFMGVNRRVTDRLKD